MEIPNPHFFLEVAKLSEWREGQFSELLQGVNAPVGSVVGSRAPREPGKPSYLAMDTAEAGPGLVSASMGVSKSTQQSVWRIDHAPTPEDSILQYFSSLVSIVCF